MKIFSKSVVMAIIICSLVFFLTLITNIAAILLLKKAIKFIMYTSPVALLYMVSYYTGYTYSLMFKEPLPNKLKKNTVLIVFVLQMVIFIFPILLIVCLSSAVKSSELMTIGMVVLIGLIVQFIVIYFICCSALEKGSLNYIKKLAPELFEDEPVKHLTQEEQLAYVLESNASEEEVTVKYCPSCAMEFDISLISCPDCRFSFLEKKTTQPEKERKEEDAPIENEVSIEEDNILLDYEDSPVKYCPSCAAELDSSTTTCPECGEELG